MDAKTCGLCDAPATWEINGGQRVIADNAGREIWRGARWHVWACDEHKISGEDFAMRERGGYALYPHPRHTAGV